MLFQHFKLANNVPSYGSSLWQYAHVIASRFANPVTLKSLCPNQREHFASSRSSMSLRKASRLTLFVAVALCFMAPPAMAYQFNVCGRPMHLLGYITQSVQVSSIDKDFYDTQEGMNSMILNAFIEGDYSFAPELKVFASGMLTYDWTYQVNTDNKAWKSKLFRKSKDRLYVDDHYWQLLKEAHVTWTPGNVYFRAGKQIVAWGEMLGVRLLDQINPLDQRRGMADVEFESTVIPIWLIRSEYYIQNKPRWIQDLGIEFIFNPNVDFIADQMIYPGNDKGGIWAPDVTIPNPFLGMGLLPPEVRNAQYLRLGSYARVKLDEPDKWSPDSYEYGIRLKMLVEDAFITLNYWYGYDNVPVVATSKPGFIPPDFNYSFASNGDILFHPTAQGYYPLQRFIGLSVARDFEWMNLKWLGGVAPLWRVAWMYNFNKKFATAVDALALGNQGGWSPADAFNECDEIRYAIACDWKVKIKWLNKRHYFMLSPQFYHRHILAYPDHLTTGISDLPKGLKEGFDMYLEDNNYLYSLMVMTQYYHGKINPSFFILHDQTNRAQFVRAQLTYDRSHKWHYSIGAIWLNGSEPGGFNVFENKDYLFFKISYRWG